MAIDYNVDVLQRIAGRMDLNEFQPNGAGGPVGVAEKVAAESITLRVVLLADDDVLRSYGPVLRRIAVGLIDEAADINLLCTGTSPLLNHLPCPPVRLIKETTSYYETTVRVEIAERMVSIKSPKVSFDYLWPSRRVLRLAQILGQYKPTLIHALSEKQAPLARKLSKQMAIPYVVSILAHSLENLSISNTRCGQILPCFSSSARKLRQHHPQLSSRVHFLPIGTHVDSKPCCFEHGQRRAQLFCCVPLDQEHGLVDLINAAWRLRNMGHKFHLTLAGKGSAEYDLRRHVKKLGLIQCVHFVSPLEKMIADNDAYKEVLQSVDIFIQTWPNKQWRPELLEALSVGNAVIAVEQDHNDLIINKHTALTVPFRNEQALAQTLDRLLKDRDYCRSLAKQGQDYVRKHFLASDMVTRLTHAYRQALQFKPKIY